mmetsp:Transcript_27971/g.75542  ORF Transcript_27971/g.75542 Transcript_27971/m.75542 type:complete len:87 (+) Transcript_27971:1012-1272(+)
MLVYRVISPLLIFILAPLTEELAQLLVTHRFSGAYKDIFFIAYAYEEESASDIVRWGFLSFRQVMFLSLRMHANKHTRGAFALLGG